MVILLSDGSYGTAIGILFASLALVFAQVIAAYLFTIYLADVAEQLGAPQWAARSNQLRSTISNSLAATSGMTSVAIVLGMLTIIGGIVTCGFGFYILLPFDVLALLGLMPLWLPVVWQMFGEYGRILTHLQDCIRIRSISPFKSEGAEIVFLPTDRPAE